MKKILIITGLLLITFSFARAQKGDEDSSMLNNVKQRDQKAIDEAVNGWWTASMKTHESRVAWWREARFGMFIHWGVYSLPGGEWKGKKVSGYAEHVMRSKKIPRAEYLELAHQFNPVKFNADEWISNAKKAGMRYFIITAKHHDGFAMFDSKASDYNIVKQTPFKRDPMAELSVACKKYGLKFGFYYSHAFDWEDPNAPGNDWDYNNPGGDSLLHGGANWFDVHPELLPKVVKYINEKSIPQIKELLTKYHPDILWFDTPHKIPLSENIRILKAIRETDPNVVVNGRLARSSNFMFGDYQNTADRPAEFFPVKGDWEGIPTTNESYGYSKFDLSHKPVSYFIRLLAKAASRGGNILMNIGPMGNGRIDEADVNILHGLGRWWTVNGESIRGTTRTPLAVQAWGESTRKGNRLYLHVFDWPSDGKLVVGGLPTTVLRACLLARPDAPLNCSRAGVDIIVAVPAAAPDAADSVIALDCAAEPRADSTRLLAVNLATNTLRAFDATLSGNLRFGSGEKNNDTAQNWVSTDDAVIWPVRLRETATFELGINYDAPWTSKVKRMVEGDAGKEIVPAHQGAGGEYVVQVAGNHFTGQVRPGSKLTETLGQVTIPAGIHEIRVTGHEITGQELLRLRSLTLLPVVK